MVRGRNPSKTHKIGGSTGIRNAHDPHVAEVVHGQRSLVIVKAFFITADGLPLK